jgi:putative nucleotidyltransferase with HDIG domain
MKFNKKIFQSKIARRIFMLFVLCAFIPVLCFSFIAYGNVTKQLKEQSYKRLQRSVKGYGLSLYERLLFLETGLKLFSTSLRKASATSLQTRFEDFNGAHNDRFKAVALFDTDKKAYRFIFNTMNISFNPASKEVEHIQNGHSVISILKKKDLSPRILMMMMVDSKDPKAGYLIGEINPVYLWGIRQGNALPPNTQFCVLDTSKNVLFSSTSYPNSFYNQLRSKLENVSIGQFEFPFGNQKYLASYWTVFMKPYFLVPGWTVVLNQSKADVLAPMSHFKLIFPLVVIMALWVVLLFSMYSIRKSLVPLELLKKGAGQIAMKHFDYRVDVKSGDEFEELAVDFNKMADQLNKQFKNLNTKSEIDRAILSSLDTKIIVETIIHHIYDLFECDCVAINLIDSEEGKTARSYLSYYGQEMELWEMTIEFKQYELEVFHAHPEYLIIDPGKNRLSFFSSFFEQEVESFLVLPVFLKEILKAVIVLGRIETKVYSTEDITQARQITDQVAVALSNANLIEELDQLNWGTLKALARTVDAKSPWTAGHSTRVTKMALEIGAVMGLPPAELDDLHRAALLHDIGKLGIPVAILDKPNALTDQEYAVIKKHPSIGARILEPIGSYKSIIPVILQHHERHDGKGYPQGLSGNDIVIGARILAVADVFDAIRSDRPYRKGMTMERVIDIITEEAGCQFDPDVVEGFLTVVRQKNTKAA